MLWIGSNLWFMCLGPVQTRDVWGDIWPAAFTATGRIATEKSHLDKDCFSALEKPPVGKKSSQWLSHPVVPWNSLFKLSINQTQALTYTSLCPWVSIVLMCGPCFPSQTFGGSYSLLPVQLLVGAVGAPFSIIRFLPNIAVSRRLRKGGIVSEVHSEPQPPHRFWFW